MFSLEELKKAKEAKKLTLQQISDLSHVPKKTVDNIFLGYVTNPRVGTLDAIKEVLGIPTEHKIEIKQLTPEMADEDQIILEKIKKLGIKEKAAFLTILDRLIADK